jgi:hypothetical protein
MVKGLQEPVAVAVDATYLYWVEQGAIGDAGNGGYGELARMAKSTPCGASCSFTVLDPMVLAGNGLYNTTMGLGPADVCYAQTFDAPYQYSVNCVSLVDGSEQNLAQSTGYVQGIWVGATDAYWAVVGSLTGVADGLVTGAALDTGKALTLAINRPSPWAVTAQGASVYWTETGLDAGQGSVEAVTPDAATEALATGQLGPQAIAVYDGYVYWANADGGTIERLALGSGSAMVEQVASGQPGPFVLAVDSSGIYWANFGKLFQNDYGGGAVAHTMGPGQPVTVDVPNLTNVLGFAVDQEFIYVVTAGTYAADYTDGEILRVGK